MSSNKLLQKSSTKHGLGFLTASAAENPSVLGRIDRPSITRLTRVAHKAPTRLVPVGKTSVEKAGAAVCALSNYGGGMLQGDSAELSVQVEKGAKLGIITQGASRIYTQRVPSECKASLHATVEKDAILVFAPDPCAMFASSSYLQTQNIDIHPESSVALIDWFSSGRFMNQERWEFDKLYSKTALKWRENKIDGSDTIPFLQDSILMDLRVNRQKDNNDPHGVAGFNCFASLILYGKQIELVQERCQALSDEFAAQNTRVRDREDGIKTLDHSDLNPRRNDVDVSARRSMNDLGLAERVIMGISKVPLPGKPSNAHVVRLAARNNEDIYRIFHECLLPLAPSFGLEFYKERIRAQRSAIQRQEISIGLNSLQSTITQKKKGQHDISSNKELFFPPSLSSFDSTISNSSFWSLAMLADSNLPTGSFAHSAGLESAAQLGMVKGEQDVEIFVQAATRSSMQLQTAFLIAGQRLCQVGNGRPKTILEEWRRLHEQSHAVMVTNQPACAASIDQGKSLARVATQWFMSQTSLLQGENVDKLLRCLKSDSPHAAPTIGLIGGLLRLDEFQVCRLYAYCLARDLVSAAVRLSLIGPLASVPLLYRTQSAAEDGIRTVLPAIEENPDDPLLAAAVSAPVIEAMHPCHEILQVRLFRS